MNEFILSHQGGFILLGTLGFIFSFLALIGTGFVLMRYKGLRDELDVLFEGKKAGSLEDVILAQSTKLKFVDQEIEELYNISNRIHDIAQKGLCKTAMIRFNPFGEKGYSQSFVLALLDGKHNGYVVSSLHTREGTRIYTKNITLGNTQDNSFTAEEREAVRQACTKS